jgi:hypothetical protein
VTNRTKKVKDNGWSSGGSIVLAEVLSFFSQPYFLSIRVKRFLLLLLICYGVLYWYVHSKPKRLSLLGAFAKLRKATVSFVMSVRPSIRPPVCLYVCPHGTARFLVDRFSWKFMSEYFFFKISRENSSLIKIWQE